jgi:hypothetical protein
MLMKWVALMMASFSSPHRCDYSFWDHDASVDHHNSDWITARALAQRMKRVSWGEGKY